MSLRPDTRVLQRYCAEKQAEFSVMGPAERLAWLDEARELYIAALAARAAAGVCGLTLPKGAVTLESMERGSVSAIVRALNDAGVRYLIAGGLAVVAHGYVRFTADLDLILDMEEGNLRSALAALKGLDYRPRAPVSIEDFADAAKRRSWVEEKGLAVFSLYSGAHKATEVDVFAEPPFEFVPAYAEARREAVAEGVVAVFIDLARLIALKERAGRPRDLDDIARLREINGGKT